MKNLLAIVSVALLLQSCATPYTGSKPDLSLRGDAALQEFNRFRLSDASLGQSPQSFEMGPTETRYTRKTIQPIIAEISPRAIDKLHTADSWRWVQHGFFAVTLGAAIATIANGHSTTTLDWIFWSSFGASFTAGIVGSTQQAAAASYFNEDLRSKLGLAQPAAILYQPRPQFKFTFNF